MKNFKRVLSLALAALMVIGGLVIAPVDAKADETTYTRVTSVAEIAAGGEFIIVAEHSSGYYAVNVAQSNNWGQKTVVTVDSNKNLTSTDAPVLVIEPGTDTNQVYIKSGSTYLMGANANKMYTTTDKTEDYTQWLVKETAGKIEFRLVGTTDRSLVYNHNSGNGGFRPYKDSAISSAPTNYSTEILVYKAAGEGGGSTPDPDPEPEEPTDLEVPAGSTMEQIVELAYTLEDGQYLAGTHTLTGVITERNYAWSETYGVSVTIQVGDLEAKPIYCYKVMTGEGLDEINVGDEITVTGKIMRYGTKYELVEGNLDSYEKAEEEPELPVVPEGATDAEIVDIAYTLASGQTLEGTYTLTGVVSEFKYTYNPDYDNIALWIVVDGKEDKPILCYKLKGEGIDVVKVGDTITVSGPITNYNGTIEFNGSTLDSIATTGDFSTTGIVVVLFVGVALVAVSVIGKRRMA